MPSWALSCINEKTYCVVLHTFRFKDSWLLETNIKNSISKLFDIVSIITSMVQAIAGCLDIYGNQHQYRPC